MRRLLTAVWIADIGPVPIIWGLTPVHAEETIRQSGVSPLFLASSSVIITTAAAPSLMEEEFPAVTLPVPSCIRIHKSLIVSIKLIISTSYYYVKYWLRREEMITLINAGLSFDKVSFVVSGLGFSSFVIRVVVPLRPGTDTETISWSKNPEKLCEKNITCHSYFQSEVPILIFLLVQL